MTTETALLLHACATLMMTGIMWFVQLAYYPNLEVVGRAEFTRYEQEHIRRIARPAWAMLLIELVSGLYLLAFPAQLAIRTVFGVNAVLLLVIWYSTWFVQVPLHHALREAFQDREHRRLVQTNWLRTGCYTVRSLLLVAILYRWLA